MEEPSNPNGAGGDGAGGDGGGRSGREVSSQGGESGVDDLDELWPSRPSSAAAKLAAIWVDNPATSEWYTYGLGGLDLDPEIWEVGIHLDGVDNLERKIGRDDITYMNVVAMIETQGYSFRDSIYCRQSDGRVILVENNAIIYELLEMFESTRVLNLTVKRRAAVVAKKQTNAASEIKGEKTFVIRKMKLKRTCPTTTDSTRVSARWLAAKYESLFRSDPNTTIQTVIDSARQHFGVEVPKMMAYRAKWLAIDAVLGDHKEQYVRLRDFAQTVVDTNPGSRVIVTTVTLAPSLDNPHPGPTFHGLFFCINGAREGFLKGCRPFIGTS
ncbi:hypothetical protein ACQ4PT_046820 [Festuca glaucescens]